ncbi:hypothetical protein ONK29_27505, partial [Salmonella enterica subsp. enterica serovar Anatum]|nr:hypothetical protein [Salmonella enterica subsp. enterica serovar Anatum]
PLYPTHAGFYWSEPEYINGKGWHASVAVADQQGVFFGVTVKLDYGRMKEMVLGVVSQNFRPEFINRIDEVVVFHPLGEQHIAS